MCIRRIKSILLKRVRAYGYIPFIRRHLWQLRHGIVKTVFLP